MTAPTGPPTANPTIPGAAPGAIPMRTLLIASLAVFAVFLDTTVLFVAFPDITASFPDVAPAQLSWVLNGYTIVFAALLVPFGKLADRRGHRMMFLTGSTAFTAASLLCAVSPSPWFLVGARVLQAAGAAALVPSSLALILRATPRERLPVALAIWGATGAVAGAVGPTLGAAMVELGGWRWVFLINLPVGIVTVLLGRRTFVESRDPDSVVPAPLGVLLVVGGTVLLTLGIVRGQDWGWTSPATLGSIAAGLVVLTIFVFHQSRTSRPALDLSLFSSRNYSWANAASFTMGVAFSAMFLSSILFLTAVWRWSILEAGVGVAPGPAIVAVLAPRMGRLASRIGQRPLLVAGGLVYAVGGAWRYVALGPESAYVTDYLPSMVFTGLGVALLMPQLASVVGQSLPQHRLAVGGAVNQAIRQFAGTIGVAMTIGLVSGATGVDDALSRFDKVWVLLIVGGVITTFLSLPLRTGASLPAVAAAPAPIAATAD